MSCFIPAETFRLASAMPVFTSSSPLNNPINLRAPSSGPRLSLFSEVSYWICFQCDVYKLIESAHARDARMVYSMNVKTTASFAQFEILQ